LPTEKKLRMVSNPKINMVVWLSQALIQADQTLG